MALLGVDDRAPVGRAQLFVGAVEVTERVTGYQRRRRSTREVLEMVPLELPPTRLRTRAFWYVVDDDLLADAGIHPARVPGTLHAVEHAAIGMLPLFTICDRWDVGGLSTNRQAQTGRATIVVYDGYPGGAGIAELGFAAGRRHLEATLEVVSSVPVRRRVPVVRAVAQVRQPQRAPRQGGSGSPPDDTSGLSGRLASGLSGRLGFWPERPAGPYERGETKTSGSSAHCRSSSCSAWS